MAVVRQGVADKGAALREILAEHGLEAHEVAYMGDDLNDLPVLTAVGLSAAPRGRRLRGSRGGLHGPRGRGGDGLPARVRGGDPARAGRLGAA